MSIHERHILQILSEAGPRGIAVKALAKHVYNSECTLFEQPDFAEIHRYVQSYVYQHSRQRRPTIECTGQRGVYRLRDNAQNQICHLLLQWDNTEDMANDATETTPAPSSDQSLSIFSDEHF